jgi:hypothetical protein
MKSAAFLLFMVAVVFSGAPAVALGLAAAGAALWWFWR